MNKIKLSLVAALLATTGAVSTVSAEEVELSANVAMTSNYVWRGMTQTGNSPAIQGGFDASYAGFYAGVWGSSLQGSADTTGEASAEFDLYAGYAGDISKFSYDVGYIQYNYPNNTQGLNFSEVYLSVGYDFDILSVSGMYSLGVSAEADNYDAGDAWELGVSVPLPAGIALDGTYGSYDDAQNAAVNNYGDYYLVSVSKSYGKFDFSLAYTGMDYDAIGNESEDNVVLTVGTSF